jgi:hypothetical protein
MQILFPQIYLVILLGILKNFFEKIFLKEIGHLPLITATGSV